MALSSWTSMPSISSGFSGSSVMVQAQAPWSAPLSRPFWPKAEAKMERVLGAATFVLIGLVTAPLAVAAELQSFWDLKREHLRILVASPQVMVTRTASGLDAYCRCPVVLKPDEIPEAMKKAIIAVEDKRFLSGCETSLAAATTRRALGRTHGSE